jgi:hypothetical protein
MLLQMKAVPDSPTDFFDDLHLIHDQLQGPGQIISVLSVLFYFPGTGRNSFVEN